MNNNKFAQRPEVIVIQKSHKKNCQHHEFVDSGLIGVCIKCGQVKQYPRLDGYRAEEASRQSLIFSDEFVRL